MNEAYFFQGDTLLLPDSIPDSQIETGIPSDLVRYFDKPDIFEIPAVKISDSPVSTIRAVSVLPGSLPEGWRAVPVRKLFAVFNESGLAGEIIRACHIAQWRRESRFCGSCGAENTDSVTEVMRLCPMCGRQEFPRICPAVITAITDNQNRLLLAHNKKFKPGMYSLISGFTEAGETLEETVVREIREEVNIEIKDVAYIKSQPWPFPNSLMIAFSARYSSGTIRPDGEEIEDAAWFTQDNLPELPGEGSLSRLLIGLWLEGALQ